MNSFIRINLIALLTLSAASCSSTKEFTDREIIVESKETVVIKELDLKITNKGCGRQWESKEGKEPYETAYCELVYQLKDSVKYAGDSYKPVYFGDIEIKLTGMNPWSAAEKGIPGGGCRLSIKRIVQK